MHAIAVSSAAWAREPSIAKLTRNQVVLFADKPGGTLTLQPVAKGGKPRTVADGTIARAPVAADPGVHVTLDGVIYQVDTVHVCMSEDRAPGPDGVMLLSCNFAMEDALHADLWYVPTFASRVKMTSIVSAPTVSWSPASGHLVAIVSAEVLFVFDPASATSTTVDGAGAPSWSATGVLHYRTLDGGAWKLDAGQRVKLGTGQRGKPGSQAIEHYVPTVWPAAITFDKTGAPSWK